MRISHVVLDFDGTCTLVEDIQQKFLDHYKATVAARAHVDGKPVGADFVAGWSDALDKVRESSPQAAWVTLSYAPAAPAWADPYIAAGEAAAWLGRRWKETHGTKVSLPPDAYNDAYRDHPAPWRPEIVEVLTELVGRGITVAFVSNSATAKIEARLGELTTLAPEVRAAIRVYGEAAKYQTRELDWDLDVDKAARKPFRKLKLAERAEGLNRPIYLRRGAYYQALLQVWGDAGPCPESTLVVGDVYELDLAMPAALGAHVHLIERAAPFTTCDYERELTRAAGGKVSADLTKVLDRVGKKKR